MSILSGYFPIAVYAAFTVGHECSITPVISVLRSKYLIPVCCNCGFSPAYSFSSSSEDIL
nr:MAG TPA: hypothetical protein [Crassvirales sp.]